MSDLFVESLSDTAERETRSQLAALNNYPGRRKKIDGHISNNNYAYDELVASTTTLVARVSGIHKLINNNK